MRSMPKAFRRTARRGWSICTVVGGGWPFRCSPRWTGRSSDTLPSGAVTVASGPVGGGIGPVAVVACHRRRGIAAEGVDAALRACPAAGFGWAVVLGSPAYYARFGFRPAREFGLSDEFRGG